MIYKGLFPEIEAYDSGYYKSDNHEIYYQQSGNPDGFPVVYVHGGPGGGGSKYPSRFFDPKDYRLISIDQRGCGKSKPFLELKNNTTEKLAHDMEAIRKLLNIEKWLVFGGSWGTTLALYYAENYPDRVMGLGLRGVFLGRKEDIDWLYQNGASYFFPEVYEKFVSVLDKEERKNNLESYYKYLTSEDEEIRNKYAKNFSDYESSLVRLRPKPTESKIEDKDLAIALMECHYFVNNCFFEENYILNNVDKIKDIPTIIIHGRYDVDCRPIGAYELSQRLNDCKLILPIGGHSSLEEEILHEIILAQEEFKKLF